MKPGNFNITIIKFLIKMIINTYSNNLNCFIELLKGFKLIQRCYIILVNKNNLY